MPLVAKVLLADDHAMVRKGLRLILDAEPDLEVVAEVGDGRAALAAARDADLDLAVLDVAMPGMTGLQAALELAKQRPDLRILMLSMHDNEQYIREAIRAGAAGYVLKTVADRDLVQSCRAVLRGDRFVHPGGSDALTQEFVERHRRGEDLPDDPLTPRESEVVKLVAEGCSNNDIAETLVISEKTVERHRANVLAKLGMSDRVQLTRYAIRRGLVQP